MIIKSTEIELQIQASSIEEFIELCKPIYAKDVDYLISMLEIEPYKTINYGDGTIEYPMHDDWSFVSNMIYEKFKVNMFPGTYIHNLVGFNESHVITFSTFIPIFYNFKKIFTNIKEQLLLLDSINDDLYDNSFHQWLINFYNYCDNKNILILT